jgi:7,8-dihydropterin-6-yl-methyl-4-(beta-D-ribofuranosyl)aminobenzene 5'-phosphate synthase
MKTERISSTLILILLLQTQSCGQDYPYLSNSGDLSKVTTTSGITEPVSVRVIYDNYTRVDSLTPDWGYSIVIEGLEKAILFDTGAKPDIFASNFRKMGLDASAIDILVLSHEHGDHTGGIPSIVKMKTGIPVIIPHSFSMEFKKKLESLGLKPLLVNEPAMICKDLYTSGDFDFPVAEQALVLDTKQGLVVMTGCSHPGIVEMLKEIKATFHKNIYMVFGGFHLLEKSEKEMDEIISAMKALGVVKCGATHCTGDMQIKMFRDAFGENYFELGVGNTIVIN